MIGLGARREILEELPYQLKLPGVTAAAALERQRTSHASAPKTPSGPRAVATNDGESTDRPDDRSRVPHRSWAETGG